MGRPKALVELRGSSFLETICRALPERCERPIVVIGACADEVQLRHRDLNLQWLRNDAWESTEMFDSLRLGLAAMQDEAALVWPVDCPHQERALVLELVTRASLCPSRLVSAFIPSNESRPGHPIALSRAAVELLRLESFLTLRDFLASPGLRVEHLPAGPEVLWNFNTPAELADGLDVASGCH